MTPRRPSSTPNLHEWQDAYELLLTETDTSKLFKLVEIAEAGVRTRRAELEGSSDHHAERASMDEALANLQTIKTERLKFRQQYFAA